MQWFSSKNIDKLFQDQFLQPVKDHPYDKFGYVRLIMPCFYFQTLLKKIKWQKIREHAFKRIKNMLERTFSDLQLVKFFNRVWKKQHVFYFFKIFKENQTF